MHPTIALATTIAIFNVGLLAQYPLSPPPPPAATTLKATLSAPAVKLAVGTPIVLELTLTTSGPWTGSPGLAWERRDPLNGSWKPFVNKSPSDPTYLKTAAATTTYQRVPEQLNVLWHLKPGTWRVQWRTHWVDADGKARRESSPWCELEITDHAGNQAAMRDTSHGMLSPWQWVASRAQLGDDVAIPKHLQGRGLFPAKGAMARTHRAITALRDSGVSAELKTAADLILLERDIRHVRDMAPGPARTQAAKQPRDRLEALAKTNAMAATPLGGQHGEVLELLHALLKIDAPKQAQQLVANVRQTKPELARLMDPSSLVPAKRGN